jgi:hypothetical protein
MFSPSWSPLFVMFPSSLAPSSLPSSSLASLLSFPSCPFFLALLILPSLPSSFSASLPSCPSLFFLLTFVLLVLLILLFLPLLFSTYWFLPFCLMSFCSCFVDARVGGICLSVLSILMVGWFASVANTKKGFQLQQAPNLNMRPTIRGVLAYA